MTEYRSLAEVDRFPTLITEHETAFARWLVFI